MMMTGFYEEVVGCDTSALRSIVKQATALGSESAPNSNPDPIPPQMEINPADISTQYSYKSVVGPKIGGGELGPVTPAKHPIDEFRFNSYGIYNR